MQIRNYAVSATTVREYSNAYIKLEDIKYNISIKYTLHIITYICNICNLGASMSSLVYNNKTA